MIIQSMQTKLNGVARLGHLGVIRVEGVDAASFLQGQLTQDFSSLGLSDARLAAYCSAQGRMLASFYGLKLGPAEILLVCSRDLLTQTIQRLSRFVMRAKAKLMDASEDYAQFGLAGDALATRVNSNQAPWSRVDINGASVVVLYPADGVPRALWLAPVSLAVPEDGKIQSLQDLGGTIIATTYPHVLQEFLRRNNITATTITSITMKIITTPHPVPSPASQTRCHLAPRQSPRTPVPCHPQIRRRSPRRPPPRGSPPPPAAAAPAWSTAD